VTVFAASARRSTGRVIDEVFRAELVVGSADGGPDGFSPEVAARLRALPGVDAVAQFREGPWRDEGEERHLTALSAEGLDRVLDLDVTSGRLADLADGGVAVFADLAADRGLDVGDLLPMEFARTGLQQVRVDALFEAQALTGEIVLSLMDFESNFADQLDSVVMVKLAPDADRAAVRRAAEAAVADLRTVEVRDQAEFKDEVADQATSILNLFYALLALAVVIALVGIVNTLALSVVERRRELGLVRAVGMGRRQVRAMVRTEGVVIAALGAVLGLVVGLVVAVAMLAALRDKGLTETSVPFSRLLAFVVAAAVAGVAAAVLPARRAARTDVLAAIAHE
jgi:putative ABC transport system permease protein